MEILLQSTWMRIYVLLEDRRGDVVIDSQGKQAKGTSIRAFARGIHPQGITKYMVYLNENKHTP